MDEFVCVPFDRVLTWMYGGIPLDSKVYIAPSYDKLPVFVREYIDEDQFVELSNLYGIKFGYNIDTYVVAFITNSRENNEMFAKIILEQA